MRRTLAPLALAVALAAAPAVAGDVSVDVRDQAGKPVRDAVVMIRPAGGVAPGTPMKVNWPMVMAQQNTQFTPYVLIVPLGSTVSFPNKDKVRHHVYSFSAPKKFELKLYGRDETRSITFDKPGAVSLGCNIHDSMIAFIFVSDTPFAAKSNPQGVAVVQDAPAGGATLLVWHPDLKARAPIARPLAVAGAAQRATVTVELRPALTR
ncbi:methylamine utilization protein [Phenylobacterium sp.]|uniref:methylamine utilization protein n=1 Tax=Phenylobacterium sp. TaxID=1871053 RepID=UPI0025F43A9F|nr:methylamine utilization protein [Phenylobacterium sp.]